MFFSLLSPLQLVLLTFWRERGQWDLVMSPLPLFSFLNTSEGSKNNCSGGFSLPPPPLPETQQRGFSLLESPWGTNGNNEKGETKRERRGERERRERENAVERRVRGRRKEEKTKGREDIDRSGATTTIKLTPTPWHLRTKYFPFVSFSNIHYIYKKIPQTHNKISGKPSMREKVRAGRRIRCVQYSKKGGGGKYKDSFSIQLSSCNRGDGRAPGSTSMQQP